MQATSKLIILMICLSVFGPSHIAIANDCKSTETLYERVLKFWHKFTRKERGKFCYHYEICELAFLPEGIRSSVFKSLATTTERFSDLGEVLSRKVETRLKEKNYKRIIEMGSGSGYSATELAKRFPNKEVLITDRFPQVDYWKKSTRKNKNLNFIENSVSFETIAKDIPAKTLKGSLVVIVSAFHHIQTTQAKKFIADVNKAGADILILEPFGRNYYGMAIGLANTVPALATPILAREVTIRERFQLMLYHWLLPVVPVIFTHDGLVSAIRQRGLKEFKGLAEETNYRVTRSKSLGKFRNFTSITYSSPN